MKSKIIYLDYAAGTPVADACLKLALKLGHDHYYNPQALYKGATLVDDLIKSYLSRIAKVLGVKDNNVIVTNGVSEANHKLFTVFKDSYPKAKIACLNIDHDSLRGGADIFLSVNPQTAQLDKDTILNLDDDIGLLSVAGINNELGVIQDFKTIKRSLVQLRTRRQKSGNKTPILLHIDASQMALIHQIKPQGLADADFVTYNGAKFYAFKNSGIIYIKDLSKFKVLKQAYAKPSLMLTGALASALEIATSKQSRQLKRLSQIQANFEDQLTQLGAEIVLGFNSKRSPHITTAIFKAIDNETLIFKLSSNNIYAGLGSACHSSTDLYQTSALRHLNYSKADIYASVRFSFGYETTQAQLKIVVKKLAKILHNLREQ